MLIYLVPLIIVLILVIVYKFLTKPSNQFKISSKPIIEFEKTICFGTCPIYKATIYEDGSVQYKGIDYVKVKGNKSYTIPMEQLNKILQKLQEINFMSLASVYDANITDVPSTIITFRGKKVKARADIPSDLAELINMIHGILMDNL